MSVSLKLNKQLFVINPLFVFLFLWFYWNFKIKMFDEDLQDFVRLDDGNIVAEILICF